MATIYHHSPFLISCRTTTLQKPTRVRHTDQTRTWTNHITETDRISINTLVHEFRYHTSCYCPCFDLLATWHFMRITHYLNITNLYKIFMPIRKELFFLKATIELPTSHLSPLSFSLSRTSQSCVFHHQIRVLLLGLWIW